MEVLDTWNPQILSIVKSFRPPPQQYFTYSSRTIPNSVLGTFSFYIRRSLEEQTKDLLSIYFTVGIFHFQISKNK